MLLPLLARGRDRLETEFLKAAAAEIDAYPLLARGRDRLETHYQGVYRCYPAFPYSLGDAIDWKQAY